MLMFLDYFSALIYASVIFISNPSRRFACEIASNLKMLLFNLRRNCGNSLTWIQLRIKMFIKLEVLFKKHQSTRILTRLDRFKFIIDTNQIKILFLLIC